MCVCEALFGISCVLQLRLCPVLSCLLCQLGFTLLTHYITPSAMLAAVLGDNIYFTELPPFHCFRISTPSSSHPDGSLQSVCLLFFFISGSLQDHSNHR